MADQMWKSETTVTDLQDTIAWSERPCRCGQDFFERKTRNMSQDERKTAAKAARFGYGPLALLGSTAERMHAAYAGHMQPGLYKVHKDRTMANAAPLGLCAFSLSIFMASIINIGTLGLKNSTFMVTAGCAYGGLIQILVGMWEIAAGNTFGATTFTSFGAYWLSYAILLIPGPNGIQQTIIEEEGSRRDMLHDTGLYMFCWFIFTFLMLLCTLKSTLPMFMLFLCLTLNYFFLGLANVMNDGVEAHQSLTHTAGALGIVAAASGWYSAFSGIADSSNSFIVPPPLNFPWTVQPVEYDEEDGGPY